MTSRAELSDYASGDQKFTDFLVKADAALEARIGMGILDIADYAWRDAYEDSGLEIDDQSMKELIDDVINECC